MSDSAAKKSLLFSDPKDMLKELEAKQKELEKFMNNYEDSNKPKDKQSAEYHLNRLLNETYVNPYDALEIPSESNDIEIKKRYKELSLLVHPDRWKHERASDAFIIVEKAYKNLIDPDKRRIYQRIMREARERVEYEREKENK